MHLPIRIKKVRLMAMKKKRNRRRLMRKLKSSWSLTSRSRRQTLLRKPCKLASALACLTQVSFQLCLLSVQLQPKKSPRMIRIYRRPSLRSFNLPQAPLSLQLFSYITSRLSNACMTQRPLIKTEIRDRMRVASKVRPRFTSQLRATQINFTSYQTT